MDHSPGQQKARALSASKDSSTVQARHIPSAAMMLQNYSITVGPIAASTRASYEAALKRQR
jgi:hypothetical protein